MQTAWLPFVVMLLNYVFALPGYVYMNAVTGTGATRTAFIFQATTIAIYLLYLWGLSYLDVPSCRLLDSGIPVRDWTWGAVCHLSEI